MWDSFLVSQLFAWDGQNIAASVLPSFLPNTQDFRMDWLDLLAVQGMLKSLLQHHSSKPSILWHSAFFTVQLSHPYMTTGKTIVLTRWILVGKVMSLLLNMLSSLFITFLPRSRRSKYKKARIVSLQRQYLFYIKKRLYLNFWHNLMTVVGTLRQEKTQIIIDSQPVPSHLQQNILTQW